MSARVPLQLLVAVTVLALAGGACSSGGSESTDPTLPAKPATTTTTSPPAPADPYAIPKVIDEAYVNRVLAALDQINGDVVRDIVATKSISTQSVERIRAVYNDPEFEVELQGIRRLLSSDFGAFKDPPGNRLTLVRKLAVTRRDCIGAEVTVDFSKVVQAPRPPDPGEFELITLRPTQVGADPKGLNPTGWSVQRDEAVEAGAQPKKAPCGG